MSAETAPARWAVGDWCYYAFELHLVKEMQGDRVVGLSNGYISAGCHDFSDRMFPVSLDMKVISEQVAADKKAVREAERGVGLNWPDLAWKFEQIWIEWASDPTRKDGWKPSQTFREGVLAGMRKAYDIEVDGIRIFGR